MNKIKIISALVTLFMYVPIWYYLLYTILDTIGANELTWFLFWVYIPVGLFVNFVTKLVEKG